MRKYLAAVLGFGVLLAPVTFALAAEQDDNANLTYVPQLVAPALLHQEALDQLELAGEQAKRERAAKRRRAAERRRRARRARAARQAAATPAGNTSPAGSGAPVAGALQAIAACESGGNPGAVGGGGAYRGKYQFDRGTWAGVGGSGDPAAASEAEQDHRAAALYARAGSSPWPNCG